MRLAVSVLALLLTPALAGAAEVTVRMTAGLVDVAAKTAPLSDVLDLLARRTGMKVTYEGPAPRQLVTLSLSGRRPVDVVHDLLEGQGLTYALMVDAAGTGVQTLLMTGSSGSAAQTASAKSSAPPRSSVAPPSNAVSVDEPEPAPQPEPELPAKTPPHAGLEGIPPALRDLIQAAQTPEGKPASSPAPPDPDVPPLI